MDATQRARVLAEACERESRAMARHPANQAARTFTLAGSALAKGATLSPKPNATRPDDWRVDEATAALAREKLAALAPHARRPQAAGLGDATSNDVDGEEWRRVLPPSTNGEYGSHLALIDAALKAEAEASSPAAGGTTIGSGGGSSSSLGQSLRLLLPSASSSGAAPRGDQSAAATIAALCNPDHGRKTSAVTQFAAAYQAMLGHSPFAASASASGSASASAGKGGAGKRA